MTGIMQTASIPYPPLYKALQALLGSPVASAAYAETPLQGGTLGDVRLLAGEAILADGRTAPFRIVRKTQAKWLRPGDPASWRREYDLYSAALPGGLFTAAFRRPQCCLYAMDEGNTELWLEAVTGRSGAALTLPDLTLAALELGRFQGRCLAYTQTLRELPCLSDPAAMAREFAQWSPDTVEYQTLRSDRCPLPAPLQALLIEMQARAHDTFLALSRLPQVLCHRDYWTENIFVEDGGVVAIDWDCAGFGVIGEDIASLIADDTPPASIGTYYRTLLPAYYQGLSAYTPLPPMEAIPVREIILLKFGYRMLQQAMFATEEKQKAEAIDILRAASALPH